MDGPQITAFLLDPADEELLAQSDGFDILRRHLDDIYDFGFCHKHSFTRDEKARFLIVRDILHALLVPVVELFDKAETLAASITHATHIEELEHAFSGHARSAFLWLQCFLSNEREREWCYTKGCPGCVIEHSLYSEFSVRMLWAACLLSDVHYPFTLDGPKLPSFRFFLEPLRLALATDLLYGDEFSERMLGKAETTRNAIEELIHQCIELELDLSQPGTPAEEEKDDEEEEVSEDDASVTSSQPASPIVDAVHMAASSSSASSSEGHGMRLKRGQIARRQKSLQLEEEQWMAEMLKRCWEQLQPELSPSQLTAVDAACKAATTVTVSEVSTVG